MTTRPNPMLPLRQLTTLTPARAKAKVAESAAKVKARAKVWTLAIDAALAATRHKTARLRPAKARDLITSTLSKTTAGLLTPPPKTGLMILLQITGAKAGSDDLKEKAKENLKEKASLGKSRQVGGDGKS